ncbi:MAG: phenylalanine--tRNA ligase subunit beta [Clostridia bacterium]|nr:phenylalanine--tRNA ligase subunit beta [Clostridia bacterium]
MKLSFTMLKDYADIPVTPDAFAKRMVMTGTAVEGVEDLGGEMERVVVGRVLTCERVEGSDHLRLCTVDVAGEAPLQIVCGAPNAAVGILAAVALEGARLPGGVKIKKGKLRGLLSEGMLCSATELKVPRELYPSVGEEGLLIFLEDYPLGSDVRPHLGLDDVSVDFEILANRPDCLSAMGIARETAAALNTALHPPEITVRSSGGDIHQEVKISVEDADLCPRFAARVIKNVRIGPSPLWMRKYLHSAGIRPICNIVDITNFVMLEYGHPMHAYDLDKVRGKKIVVRRAGDRTGGGFSDDKTRAACITTLDGVERTLRPGDLLICDGEGPTGLAGIMGGRESEITESTRDVLFECASFDRTSIRLTGRALGMRTESSGRFERGVSPATVLEALQRSCMLVNELDAGDVVNGVIDLYPAPAVPQAITASIRRIRNRAGVDIPANAMEDILTRLGFGVTVDGDSLTATAPLHRGDLDGEADLCEEVLRIYGYEHIAATPFLGQTTQGGHSSMGRLKNQAASLLHGYGYYEIMNYSFQGMKEIAKLGLAPEDPRMRPLPIRNPLGEDTAVMRGSLVPDMLTTLAFNMNHATGRACLYEMGTVFDPHHVTAEGLPTETQWLCLGIYGENADFFALRGVVEALLAIFGIPWEVVPGADSYYHPGRCARLIRNDILYAQLGEAHPNLLEAFDMPRRALVAEVNLQRMLADAVPMGEVKPLPRFPAVTRDLALAMAESVAIGPLMADMKKSAGNMLESLTLFDVYRGIQLGLSRKSAAFSLSFRAPDRTLTEAEVQKVMDRVQGMCAEKYQAVIRE